MSSGLTALLKDAGRLSAGTVALGLLLAGAAPAQTVTGSDRRAVLEHFEQRFTEEIFPLLRRGTNGCAGCHHPDSPQAFRVLDSSGATFSLLLEGGLLAPNDPVAIPGRIATANLDLKMPQVGHLSSQEQALVRSFAGDLARARADVRGDSRPPDEVFPDALLLAFDGPHRQDTVRRKMSYFQLRRSFETLFGKAWLAGSGPDPFLRKANLFGGADFRASFETSRAVSASYLASLQEVAREVARRFVSAPRAALFEGFDPDVFAEQSRKRAVRNVRALYGRILRSEPDEDEIGRALALVEEVQGQPVAQRTVRFTLNVRDEDGRTDRSTVDAVVRAGSAQVSRFLLDQTLDGDWARIGAAPFQFDKQDAEQFVRVVARPGNHVTAFDAVQFRRVRDGREVGPPIVLDNLDPECVLTGHWEPVEKDGERSRAGPPKKKYDLDLSVVGSNHLESRSLDNRLATATMALRIPESGAYNVYLSWPAVPRLAQAALVEVRSSAGPSTDYSRGGGVAEVAGFARIRVDQTESTLDESGETQWELVLRDVEMADADDFVEINNKGVDPAKHVLAADAVKFAPLGGGPEIIVDNGSPAGFEMSDGWARDELTRNAPGRGKAFGPDLVHYPPSNDGNPIEGSEVDPAGQVWARYRPVLSGAYQPGRYSVYLWTPGGHTHSDWVAVDIHGKAFGPTAAVEAVPEFITGQTVILDGTGSHHPLAKGLTYTWSHDAADLGPRMDGRRSAAPRLTISSLRSARPGWAGLIEALLQRPEFIMPSDSPDADRSTVLTRVALDLVGRVPTPEELRRFADQNDLPTMVDHYLASPDFKEFFFHRARAILRSRGTQESDEPARLWTYLAVTDRSYRELLTADYTVSADWGRVGRRPEHGETGMLTMKGFLVGKPGLPSFTYPAQVLTFALGLQFEVTDAVEQAREKVVSTTDPASMCYSCHKLLTPLAYQRERWDVHGHYRTVDDGHEPIDDTDRGVVPDYPFKGEGLAAFAAQAVRKERFVRTFVNRHHDMLFHRQLRIHEDHRDEYKSLHDFAVANDLRIRPLLKRLVIMRYGRGDTG